MQLKTILLTSFGFLFLVVGAIGLLLPVWPTTPFVLISVVCFSSAPRIKARIMKISFFKEYMDHYESGKYLSKKTICLSLGWLWGMLLLSMILVRSWRIVLLLSIIGLAVTSHIMWISRSKAKKKGNIQ